MPLSPVKDRDGNEVSDSELVSTLILGEPWAQLEAWNRCSPNVLKMAVNVPGNTLPVLQAQRIRSVFPFSLTPDLEGVVDKLLKHKTSVNTNVAVSPPTTRTSRSGSPGTRQR